MLLLTPALVPDGQALAAVQAALPYLDVIQVRPKPLGPPGASCAREAWDLCRALLERLATVPHAPLVVVNDRVDVALDKEVRAAMKENPKLEYSEAADVVFRENPELAQRFVAETGDPAKPNG